MTDRGRYDQEMILDNALVPAPLGTVDAGYDPYNNAIVYFLAFFGLIFFVFGLAAIGVAAYRIGKHRTHAVRGLVVAVLATVVGIGVAVAAAASMT